MHLFRNKQIHNNMAHETVQHTNSYYEILPIENIITQNIITTKVWFRFLAMKIKNNIDTTVIHEIIYEAVNHKTDDNINLQ